MLNGCLQFAHALAASFAQEDEENTSPTATSNLNPDPDPAAADAAVLPVTPPTAPAVPRTFQHLIPATVDQELKMLERAMALSVKPTDVSTTVAAASQLLHDPALPEECGRGVSSACPPVDMQTAEEATREAKPRRIRAPLTLEEEELMLCQALEVSRAAAEQRTGDGGTSRDGGTSGGGGSTRSSVSLNAGITLVASTPVPLQAQPWERVEHIPVRPWPQSNGSDCAAASGHVNSCAATRSGDSVCGKEFSGGSVPQATAPSATSAIESASRSTAESYGSLATNNDTITHTPAPPVSAVTSSPAAASESSTWPDTGPAPAASDTVSPAASAPDCANFAARIWDRILSSTMATSSPPSTCISASSGHPSVSAPSMADHTAIVHPRSTSHATSSASVASSTSARLGHAAVEAMSPPAAEVRPADADFQIVSRLAGAGAAGSFAPVPIDAANVAEGRDATAQCPRLPVVPVSVGAGPIAEGCTDAAECPELSVSLLTPHTCATPLQVATCTRASVNSSEVTKPLHASFSLATAPLSSAVDARKCANSHRSGLHVIQRACSSGVPRHCSTVHAAARPDQRCMAASSHAVDTGRGSQGEVLWVRNTHLGPQSADVSPPAMSASAASAALGRAHVGPPAMSASAASAALGRAHLRTELGCGRSGIYAPLGVRRHAAAVCEGQESCAAGGKPPEPAERLLLSATCTKVLDNDLECRVGHSTESERERTAQQRPATKVVVSKGAAGLLVNTSVYQSEAFVVGSRGGGFNDAWEPPPAMENAVQANTAGAARQAQPERDPASESSAVRHMRVPEPSETAVMGVLVVLPDGSPCVGWLEAHPAVVRSLLSSYDLMRRLVLKLQCQIFESPS
jgi:hypothetical protein